MRPQRTRVPGPTGPAGPRRRPAAPTLDPRARARRRRAGTAALAVLATLVVGAALPHASASRLDVHAERSAIVARSACTTTEVDVVPTSTSAPTAVTLDGLTAIDAAACAGAPVSVTLFGAAGVLGTAEGTLATVDQSYALTGAPAPSDVTRVRVLVGGFAIPAGWRVPGPAPDSCWVVDANGAPVARPCTVTGYGDPSFWQEGGYWKAYWKVLFSAPGITPTEHVEFAFTVPDRAVPATGWSWQDAVITSANNVAVVHSRCAELPVVRGMLPANRGETPEVQVFLTTAPGMPVICRP